MEGLVYRDIEMALHALSPADIANRHSIKRQLAAPDSCRFECELFQPSRLKKALSSTISPCGTCATATTQEEWSDAPMMCSASADAPRNGVLVEEICEKSGQIYLVRRETLANIAIPLFC
jgi:hypothetical protein